MFYLYKEYLFTEKDNLEYIGEFNSEDDCWKYISKYLKDNDIKSYYYQYYMKDGIIHIDYGSHTRFFQISDHKLENN